MRTKLHWCLIGAFALVAGCGGNRFANVARRATFDLGCEVSPDDVQHLGGGWTTPSYGVVACGCRATYIVGASGLFLNVVSGDGCHVTAGGEAPQPRR
jgi:hypothetical protein